MLKREIDTAFAGLAGCMYGTRQELGDATRLLAVSENKREQLMGKFNILKGRVCVLEKVLH